MTRRQTLIIYATIWLAIYTYAVVAGISTAFTPGLLQAIPAMERFLNLQVVACFAAAAVLVAGRQFRASSRLRTATYAPAVVTVGGTLLVAFVLGHPPAGINVQHLAEAPGDTAPVATPVVPQMAFLRVPDQARTDD